MGGISNKAWAESLLHPTVTEQQMVIYMKIMNDYPTLVYKKLIQTDRYHILFLIVTI